MSNHKCKSPTTCTCDRSALTPDESCPIHGSGEFPPRCEECGKFLSYKSLTKEEISKFFDKLAESKGLVEIGGNKWKFKKNSFDEPYYYRLTSLGFQPRDPIGFTRNSEIDNTIKPITFIAAMIIGFLFGILIMIL